MTRIIWVIYLKLIQCKGTKENKNAIIFFVFFGRCYLFNPDFSLPLAYMEPMTSHVLSL